MPDGYEATSLAGAFILGAAVGFIICIRLFRLVLEYLRDRRNESRD